MDSFFQVEWERRIYIMSSLDTALELMENIWSECEDDRAEISITKRYFSNPEDLENFK